MVGTSFRNIWFRGKKRKNLIQAFEDTGTLKIEHDSAEYVGKECHLIMSNIRTVGYGKASLDPVNNWVMIEYWDGRRYDEAYFADGGGLGLDGILGGTKKMYDTIKLELSTSELPLLTQTSPSEPISKPKDVPPPVDLRAFNSTISIIAPSHIVEGETSELIISLNNGTKITFNNVHADLSGLEDVFIVQGDLNLKAFTPGMELERCIRIKSKYEKGSFPVKIFISSDGASIEKKCVIKVGGTEIY